MTPLIAYLAVGVAAYFVASAWDRSISWSNLLLVPAWPLAVACIALMALAALAQGALALARRRA